MRLRFLATAEPGLRWFRSYYRNNPQLDRAKAIKALELAASALIDFPLLGAIYEDLNSVREYKVSGTAFSLLYAVERETVWIIDVRDQRGRRSAKPLQEYLAGLRTPET